MGWIDRWDTVLALIAGYVAVMSLVRLMARRRDQDVAEVERQMESIRKTSQEQTRLKRPRRRLKVESLELRVESHKQYVRPILTLNSKPSTFPMPKLYIETVGCQMNMLDSELVVASLRKDGYELTASPADADTILFNTCSVRQHAEDKIYSALGRLKNAKREHPNKVIGVLGCMAQKDQGLIFKRAPYVDLVVGPGQLHQVPALVREARAERRQRMEVSLGRTDGSRDEIERSHESFDPLRDPAMRPTPYQAFVRIMIGCDKFCTYCIVPSVRGPEQSRPPAAILAEARQLAGEGCLEITLLGQTVNSYKYRAGDRTWRLSDLIEALHEIDGLERIKFVTNYPKDMTDDLLGRGPRPAEVQQVPARAGPERIERGAQADEAGLHGRRLPRNARPHLRIDPRRRGHQRLHRRLLRRDGRRFPADDRAGA